MSRMRFNPDEEYRRLERKYSQDPSDRDIWLQINKLRARMGEQKPLPRIFLFGEGWQAQSIFPDGRIISSATVSHDGWWGIDHATQILGGETWTEIGNHVISSRWNSPSIQFDDLPKPTRQQVIDAHDQVVSHYLTQGLESMPHRRWELAEYYQNRQLEKTVNELRQNYPTPQAAYGAYIFVLLHGGPERMNAPDVMALQKIIESGPTPWLYGSSIVIYPEAYSTYLELCRKHDIEPEAGGPVTYPENRKNPDEELRKLERQVQEDPENLSRYYAGLLRAGRGREAIEHCASLIRPLLVNNQPEEAIKILAKLPEELRNDAAHMAGYQAAELSDYWYGLVILSDADYANLRRWFDQGFFSRGDYPTHLPAEIIREQTGDFDLSFYTFSDESPSLWVSFSLVEGPFILVWDGEEVIENLGTSDLLGMTVLASATDYELPLDVKEIRLLIALESQLASRRRNPRIPVLETLRHELTLAAQKVYDNWDQNEEGFCEDNAYGGICHDIAEAFCDVLSSHDLDCTMFSPSIGEVHVYAVANINGDGYRVDIDPYIYETGGGYTWRKIKDIVFAPDDIIIEPMGYPFADYIEN